MNKNIAVKLQNISKVYKLYDKPIDRLKESIHPFKKKYHKDFYALKNINLEIKKGEVLGIVGVNGAGKSTLLKIISGVMSPSSGRVNIHGRINAILELGAGLKPEMTGRQNIKLSLQINSIVNSIEEITQEIINFADIGEHIDQPIKTYSSGMKARLGFAIATSTDPDVLIVDEVLAVGDVLFQRKCYGKIEKLFKDGKTVIFVSHSAQSVIEFCSRAILLYDREIILDDTPKKVTDFYQKLVFNKNHKKVLDEIHGKLINTKNTNNLHNSHSKVSRYNHEKYYLESFKSNQNIISNHKIELLEVGIFDADDKKVNILKTGNKYEFYYRVKFYEDANDVIFGGLIKTIKGLGLGGININNSMYKKTYIKSGEIIACSIIFECKLLDGVYLSNIGIFSIIENEQIFLYRNVDVLIFKVMNNDNKSILGGGIIDIVTNVKITGEEDFY